MCNVRLLCYLSACLIWLALVQHPAKAENKPMFGTWGVEIQHVSKDTHPGDDFYRYVNHGWLKSAELPQGFPRFDNFMDIHLRTEERIKAILDKLTQGKTEGIIGGDQISALYTSYMDEARIEELGLSVIQSKINEVLASKTHKEIVRFMGRPFYPSIMGGGVDLDPKNPDRYILMVSQSGLGLPERDYYLKNEAPFPGHRKAYVDYIENVLKRANIDRPRERAVAILAFETEIAKRHWPSEQLRDVLKNYHPMTVDELVDYVPGFDWMTLLEEQELGAVKNLILYTDTAVKGMASLFSNTSVDVLRSYMVFHFIDSQAAMLPKAYADAQFDFYSRRLSGIDQMRDRPSRATQYVNGALGELLGRVYVQLYFPSEHKQEMQRYIPFIREAFRKRLENLVWMDEPTKKEALAKLDNVAVKIGYPDQWRDYSSIEIKPDDLIGNTYRIGMWGWKDSISRLGKPRRKWEWYMLPQQVNAYYAPVQNEIVFPAVILQPPFFDVNADPAVNFAAIGAVIGHELGHGFDDQGSHSDGKGVLRNWWSDVSRKQFEDRTRMLVEQYSAYEPIEGLKVNGQLTLGENIGDLGGLTIAYAAYQRFIKNEYGGNAPVIDGLTGDQRFFMSWAQLWRSIQTEDSARNRLLTDPHSPNQHRVNGVVRNIDAWYEAFGVTKDHELYLPPEKRVRIW